ncbi:hypothetical protein [Helicobacter brantae]|uniref:Ferric reductase n=1 Tax=Helicobacter brantae TaxID=375927 RepID=A0A3D8J2H4_9HELI|nr:hypothetical protein [Helicobacter brantae]RDU71717.1 hypothetical protein CQA58_01380 [Helicobacter brantae]
MRNFLAFLLFVAFFCVGFMGLLYVEGLEFFADPIKVFYQWSGWGAYIALVAGMVLPKGKWWGLLSLNLALLHLSVFMFFDFYFDWGLMIAEVSKKPYIYMGVGALVLMSVLGVFSFGKRFFPSLRFLVWGAMLLSLAHIVMIQKVLSLWIWGGVGVSLAILCFKVFKSSFSSNFKK